MILKSEDSLVYWKFNMISKVVSFLTKQLKQKKKLLLKSLFILLLWFSFLPQQNYFSFNEAYADTNDTQETIQKDKLSSIDVFLQAISDVAFALLWPLVALAWLAMDNSLIYGSFMWLDVTLWNIWQIVRTFANYTLWFLFLAWILWYNLSWKAEIKWMKLTDLVKNVLIASVLIQASWFIMMVLVDLSTIMTYGIWWLPYAVFDNTSIWSWDDSKMFKMVVDLDLWDYEVKASNKWDVSDAIKYYWNVTWSQYVAPCETATVKFSEGQQSFIIGRKFSQLWEWKTAIPWYCMYYWALVSFNDFYNPYSGEDYWATLKAYRDLVQDDTKDSYISQLVNAWIIFPLNDWKVAYVQSWNVSGTMKVEDDSSPKREFWADGGHFGCEKKVGIISSKKKKDSDDWECLYSKSNWSPELTLSNLMKKANSMTWPFAALYSSMAVYSNLNVSGKWLWQKFVISLVNTCVAWMLILPLIALVIVLFARIWLLWVAIAISPFLVLVYMFDKFVSLPESLKDHLSFSNLIKLLLAPVLISFAVGISLVFMSVLKSAIWIWTTDSSAYVSASVDTKEFFDNFKDITGVEMSWSDLDILWFIKVKLDSTMLNISWIIVMFFWIWISWFLLFWAIKQTSIWNSIWSKIQGLWETFLSTTPIIPVGKYWLSWSWLKEAPDEVFRSLTSDMKSNDRARLDRLLDFWSTRVEKQWRAYVESSTNLKFNDAFRLNDSDYSKTADMLGRLDAVYKTNKLDWNTRGNEISEVYWKMIWTAKTKSDLDNIVSHINEKASDKVSLSELKPKIDGTEYTIKKWENWKYVLEGGDNTADGK